MRKYKIKNKWLVKNNEITNPCLLGISITNQSMFNQQKVKCLVDWLKSNYESGIIIIGDYLNRHNEKIFFTDIESCAIGKEIESNLKKHLTIFDGFKVKRWSYYYNTKPIRDRINHFSDNRRLVKKLLAESGNFLDKKNTIGNNNLKVTYKEALQYSSEYLIEEISVFDYLAEHGYSTHIYEGSHLPILLKMAKGRVKHINTSLKEVNFQQIRFSKRK